MRTTLPHGARVAARHRHARALLIFLISGACASGGAGRAAPTADAAPRGAPSRAPADKAGCRRNLERIYGAIEAYKAERGDLPRWLSDLVPGYIGDTNTLVCPVCRRTGRSEPPPLGESKISSSYLFEFCPVPLRGRATNGVVHTRREWKQRQMDLVGAIVPIVRCRWHEPVLNLAFDGRIYDSPRSWETLLTNQVDPADLTFARIFGLEPLKLSGQREGKTGSMKERAASATNAPAERPQEHLDAARAPQVAVSNFQLQSSQVEAPVFPAAPPPPSQPPPAPDWTPVLLWCAWMAAVTVMVALFMFRARARGPGRRPRQPALLPATLEPGVAASSCTVVVAPQSLTGSALEATAVSSPASSRLRLQARGPRPKPTVALPPPALMAPLQVERRRSLERAGLLAYLSLWLKQKLVRKLIADRAELMRTQQSAALQIKHVDERLMRIERQIQAQNRTYEQRIEELTRELLVAKEENRALIQARIDQVKVEMEAARARTLAQAEREP